MLGWFGETKTNKWIIAAAWLDTLIRMNKYRHIEGYFLLHVYSKIHEISIKLLSFCCLYTVIVRRLIN
jgi:hypothetical protein